MAFNRVLRQENDFSIVSNLICRNKEISLKAIGVYFKVMSLPDTWDFTIEGLVSIIKEGRETVYSAIKELKQHGYCHIEQVREKGKMAGTIYHFYNKPTFPNDSEPNTEKPNTVKPITSQPNTSKPTQLSKKESSIKQSNNLSNKVSNNEESEIKNFAPTQDDVISFDENGNQITNYSLTEKTKRKQTGRAAFVPPTVGEVYEEAIQKGLTREEARFESTQFVNYYESIGWVSGKKKIVSWKAAFAGWLNRSAKWNKERAKQQPTTDGNRRNDYNDIAEITINSLIK